MNVNQADKIPERAAPSLPWYKLLFAPDSGVKWLTDPMSLPASTPRTVSISRAAKSRIHLRSGLNLTISSTSRVCRSECHLHLACLLSAWIESLHSFLGPARRILRLGPGGSDGKESACNVGDSGWIPGSGRSPEEGTGYPLQYSCLENSMDRRA